MEPRGSTLAGGQPPLTHPPTHTHTYIHKWQASAEEFGITPYKMMNGSSPALKRRRPSRTCTRHGLYALRHFHAPRRLTAVTQKPHRGTPYSDGVGQRYLDWTCAPSPVMRATSILCATSPGTKFSGHHPILARRLPSSSPLCHANPALRLLLYGNDYIMIYNEACTFEVGE